MEHAEHAIYPVEALEVRQEGRTIRGRFRYNVRATMSDRGRVRKEEFRPRAFGYAVENAESEVHLLRGHTFDQPLASKRAGSLRLTDTDEALEFEATLPEPADQPGYMRDTLNMIRAGLVGGLSPGFRVPPRETVPGAETIEPEPDNPDVAIRVINAAVLYELSLVTRPAYPETEVDVRQWALAPVRRRRIWL